MMDDYPLALAPIIDRAERIDGSRLFEYIDAIPRTATGKWRKTALRERFAAGTADQLAPAAEPG
jgi:acyl-CoA synthetase (AMP-forming)/AMP-acid ligase II